MLKVYAHKIIPKRFLRTTLFGNWHCVMRNIKITISLLLDASLALRMTKHLNPRAEQDVQKTLRLDWDCVIGHSFDIEISMQ